MKLTKEQLEKFYNSPISCSILQGLCSNPNVIGKDEIGSISSMNVVSLFQHITAKLHLEMEKLSSKEE